MSETERCIEYDIHVVDRWLSHLETYTNCRTFLEGKTILELGPGSDLGIGLYLLAKGAAQYKAFDVNDLMKNTPYSFYEAFLEKLSRMNSDVSKDLLIKELLKAQQGDSKRVSYIVRGDFNLASAFRDRTIDIVFSQAAFEHFDNIDTTIAQLSMVCKPGAIIVAQIDLKTHSRWIRDIDPNNIY